MTFLRNRKSFKHSTLSSNQTTGLTAGSPILFAQDDETVGNQIADINSNSWVLTAGRKYLLKCACEGLFSSGDAQFEYRWYDITGSSFLGQIGNIRGASSGPTNASIHPSALATFNPSVDSTVEVRIVSNISSLCTNILAANAWATLETID